MKKVMMILATLGFMGMSVAHAEETVSEKAAATGNSVKRSAKKGANRVKEAVCSEGDAKCLAKKAKHRVEEGTDTVKDKGSEVKNDVDSK